MGYNKGETIDETHERGGVYGEALTIDALHNKGNAVKVVTKDKESQKNDIDLYTTRKNGDVVKIECKTDAISEKTGNLAYEMACQMDDSEADEFRRVMKVPYGIRRFQSTYDEVMAAIVNYPTGCFCKSTADFYSYVNVHPDDDDKTMFKLTESDKCEPAYWINRINLNNYVINRQKFECSIVDHKEKNKYTGKTETKHNILLLIPFKDLENLKGEQRIIYPFSSLDEEWAKSYFEPHTSQEIWEINQIEKKCTF